MTATTNAELEQRLQHALLVHTDADAWELAIERADREGGGLVLHGRRGLEVARYVLDQKKFDQPILLDASAYTGKRRKLASDSFDTNWIRQQQRLRLPAVMPDAGYVGEDDEAGLLSILQRVHEEKPGTVAPLALHRSWLNAKHGLPTLHHHVREAQVPIAVMLEHTADPLGVRYVLRGLVELLQLDVPVFVLRCDTSALGALCFGAFAAAVGTRTGLRHLFPLSNGGPPSAPSAAALVRDTLSYLRLEKIDQAVAADPDNHMWWCECGVCNGQDLSWLNTSTSPEAFAYMHSVEVLYEIRADLFAEEVTPQQRRQAWIARCDAAIFRHEEIAAGSYTWEPPDFLGNWTSLRDREAIG